MRLTQDQLKALQKLAGNSFAVNIPAKTITSLSRKRLIEPVNQPYCYRLTEEGIARLYEYEVSR